MKSNVHVAHATHALHLANPASSSRLFALVPVSLPQHVKHSDGEFGASNCASPVQTRLWRVGNVQILFYCWT